MRRGGNHGNGIQNRLMTFHLHHHTNLVTGLFGISAVYEACINFAARNLIEHLAYALAKDIFGLKLFPQTG